MDLACIKKAYKNEMAIASLDMLARLIKNLQLPTANRDLPILGQKTKKKDEVCGRIVHYKRFLGEMQIHRLRKTVAEEYLEALRDFGLIRFKKDLIVWNNQKRALRSRV